MSFQNVTICCNDDAMVMINAAAIDSVTMTSLQSTATLWVYTMQCKHNNSSSRMLHLELQNAAETVAHGGFADDISEMAWRLGVNIKFYVFIQRCHLHLCPKTKYDLTSTMAKLQSL